MSSRRTRATSAIEREIQQTRPFHSIGAQAVVGLMRTGAFIQRNIDMIVAREGITQPQYNVLRILRGAGAEGITTLAIRERMVAVSPGVTRLLDRLDRAGYVSRKRPKADRRQVICRITPAGLSLLKKLDGPIGAHDDSAVSMLSMAERKELVRLLDAVRGGGTPTP